MGRKYYLIFNEGSRVNQVICAVLINLPLFLYGSAMGWMSPMTLLLQSENSPRDEPLTDSEVSWMAAMAYGMSVPGSFMMAFLGDKIGRKNTIFIISTSALVCWTTKLISMHTWAFIFARAMVGVMMGGAYVSCPLYTKEISENVIRGMLGSTVILFHTIGNLFLYVIGDILSYQTILWVCLTAPAIHIALFTIVPESPSYLLKKGKTEKAAKALAWLRCRREDDVMVLKELDELKKEHTKDDKSDQWLIKDVLTDKILFRAFKIALLVAFARDVCGIVPVLNFAGQIFTMASKDTGLILSPNQQAMMLGTVQVLGSILTIGLVEKVGRKAILFTTALLSGIGMCTLASWFLARDFDVHAPAWIPVVTLCLCIFCDAFGLLPMAVVINAELFSFKYRGTVMAVVMASASLMDFVQMLFFKAVIKNIGPYSAFYFFGAVCLLTAIYTIVVIPETKARSLDEIYEDLKTKKEKKMELEDRIKVKQSEMIALITEQENV